MFDSQKRVQKREGAIIRFDTAIKRGSEPHLVLRGRVAVSCW